MRPRPENGTIVKLALVATLAVAAISLIVAVHNLKAGRQPVPDRETSLITPGDVELIRCRDIGMAAAGDEDCLAAWSDEQRRFFGTSNTPPSAPAAPLPADGAEEGAVEAQAGGMEAP